MTGYQMSGDSKRTVYEQIEVLREEKMRKYLYRQSRK